MLRKSNKDKICILCAIKMRQKGYSLKETAKLYGVSVDTLKKALQGLNNPQSKPHLYHPNN